MLHEILQPVIKAEDCHRFREIGVSVQQLAYRCEGEIPFENSVVEQRCFEALELMEKIYQEEIPLFGSLVGELSLWLGCAATFATSKTRRNEGGEIIPSRDELTKAARALVTYTINRWLGPADRQTHQ